MAPPEGRSAEPAVRDRHRVCLVTQVELAQLPLFLENQWELHILPEWFVLSRHSCPQTNPLDLRGTWREPLSAPTVASLAVEFTLVLPAPGGGSYPSVHRGLRWKVT